MEQFIIKIDNKSINHDFPRRECAFVCFRHFFFISGSLIPWETFRTNYDLTNQSYYKWLQIVKALPGEWKNIISSENTVLDITNVSPIFCTKQECFL